MSRIKELKQHPDNNISMVDVFKVLCPEGKTKYIEFLLRLFAGVVFIVNNR